MLSFLFVVIFVGFSWVIPSYAALSDGYISGCLEAPGWTPSHVATLNIKKGEKNVPAINAPTWVFVCVTSGVNTYCSTGGDGSADELLFGTREHFEKMKGMIGPDAEGNIGYVGGVVIGPENWSTQIPPGKTNSNGADPQFAEVTTWGDAYYPGVAHQWSWVQEAVPIQEGGGAAGTEGALQQATSPFDKLVTSTFNDCEKISWDPRGVVFDVNTLLPVKGLAVELYKRNAQDIYDLVPNGLFLINPSSTSHPGPPPAENGQYSFFVDTGWYKLKMTNATPIVILSSTQMDIATNLGIDNIYTEDKAIYEEIGTVKIANIPVNVTDETLLIKDLTIIDNVLTSEGGGIQLFGRVSHAKTKMIITKNMMDAAGVIKQFITTDYTDGLGEFNKSLTQTVDSTEPLVFQGATVAFELNSFYTTGVFSQNKNKEDTIAQFLKGVWDGVLEKIETKAAVTPSNTIIIKPMPTYIEGIAYDVKGVAIPKAIVGLYPFYSEKPYYMTIADENGRYKIGSQHIPRFEYKLRYKKATGEVIVIDTGTFIKQNVKLIITEGIKPYAEKKTTPAEEKYAQNFFANITAPIEMKDPNQTQKATSSNKYAAGSSSNSSSRDPSGNPTKVGGGMIGQGMQGVIMIVVVIMILLMIGVGAFIMMKSKQQTPQY